MSTNDGLWEVQVFFSDQGDASEVLENVCEWLWEGNRLDITDMKGDITSFVNPLFVRFIQLEGD